MTDELSTRETDQRFAELRAIADSLGVTIAGRCKHCGAVITDPKSLAVSAGSVCRTRHEENDPGATPAKKSRTEAA